MGFAYNAGGQGKTVVRGGFATMYQPLNGEIEKNMIQNAVDKPFRANVSRQDAQRLGLRYPAYNEDVLRLIGTGVAAPNYQYMDPNVHSPYSMNFTLTIERALSGSLALETAFVGTRGVKLIGVRAYNQPDRVTGSRPNPNLATDNYYDNSDSSHYYGWQTSLRKRYPRGLLANLHYTGEGHCIQSGRHRFWFQLHSGFLQHQGEKAAGRATWLITSSRISYISFPRGGMGRAMRPLIAGWEVSGAQRAHGSAIGNFTAECAGGTASGPHRSGSRDCERRPAIPEPRGVRAGSGERDFRRYGASRHARQWRDFRTWLVEPRRLLCQSGLSP